MPWLNLKNSELISYQAEQRKGFYLPSATCAFTLFVVYAGTSSCWGQSQKRHPLTALIEISMIASFAIWLLFLVAHTKTILFLCSKILTWPNETSWTTTKTIRNHAETMMSCSATFVIILIMFNCEGSISEGRVTFCLLLPLVFQLCLSTPSRYAGLMNVSVSAACILARTSGNVASTLVYVETLLQSFSFILISYEIERLKVLHFRSSVSTVKDFARDPLVSSTWITPLDGRTADRVSSSVARFLSHIGTQVTPSNKLTSFESGDHAAYDAIVPSISSPDQKEVPREIVANDSARCGTASLGSADGAKNPGAKTCDDLASRLTGTNRMSRRKADGDVFFEDDSNFSRTFSCRSDDTRRLSAAQAEAIAKLEARHSDEIKALIECHADEMSSTSLRLRKANYQIGLETRNAAQYRVDVASAQQKLVTFQQLHEERILTMRSAMDDANIKHEIEIASAKDALLSEKASHSEQLVAVTHGMEKRASIDELEKLAAAEAVHEENMVSMRSAMNDSNIKHGFEIASAKDALISEKADHSAQLALMTSELQDRTIKSEMAEAVHEENMVTMKSLMNDSNIKHGFEIASAKDALISEEADHSAQLALMTSELQDRTIKSEMAEAVHEEKMVTMKSLMNDSNIKHGFEIASAKDALISEKASHSAQLASMTFAMEKRVIEGEREHLRSMIGNVAHDLKTPLQALLLTLAELDALFSSLQILLASQGCSEDVTAITSEGFDSLQVLLHSATFMRMNINRAVDFSKVSGGMSLAPLLSRCNVVASISSAVSCMMHMQSSVEIVLVPAELSAVGFSEWQSTDRVWLEENMLCLLSNAVKYSSLAGDVGSVRISLIVIAGGNADGMDVSARQSLDILDERQEAKEAAMESTVVQLGPSARQAPLAGTGAWLRIVVEDFGITPSVDAMATMLEPLKQQDRSTGGSGVGLFCLSKRVEALGGVCGVGPRADGERGCAVWFTIPILFDTTTRCEVEMIGAASGASPPIRPHPLRNGSTTGALSGASSPIRPHLLRNGPTNLGLAAPSPGSLSVPRSLQESLAPLAPLAPLVPPVTAVRTMGLRILLVDDSLTILNVVARVLKKSGHNVETASNGKLALDMMLRRGDEFDFVLMDLQMPVMGGIEAAALYRQHESRRVRDRRPVAETSLRSESQADTVYKSSDGAASSDGHSQQAGAAPPGGRLPMVAMSANSDAETRASALGAGMDVFIGKPFAMDDLNEALSILLA